MCGDCKRLYSKDRHSAEKRQESVCGDKQTPIQCPRHSADSAVLSRHSAPHPTATVHFLLLPGDKQGHFSLSLRKKNYHVHFPLCYFPKTEEELILVFNIPIITNLLEPTTEDRYRLETAGGVGRAAPESGQRGSVSPKLTEQGGVSRRGTAI